MQSSKHEVRESPTGDSGNVQQFHFPLSTFHIFKSGVDNVNFKKRLTAAVLACCISALMFTTGAVVSTQAEAATFSEINASEVFLKQQEYDTCTLCANVMMLRRTAMLRGDSDWASITEYACRPYMWVEGVGIYNYYSYKNIDVSYGRIQYDAVSELKSLLAKHPEGVVAYDFDHPHAILLTDYTDGTFYCADPANSITPGRIKASEALISVGGVEAYWYVDSPSVSLSTDAPVITSCKEYWKVTASGGVNVRSGAGTDYSTKSIAEYGEVLKITKKTTSNGYTWGYTNTNSLNGWIALDYTKKVSLNALGGSSTISNSSVIYGNSVTVKAYPSGGSGSREYCFSYRKSDQSSWTDISSYSSTKSVSFKPSSIGTYYVRVKIHDKVTGEVVQIKHTVSVSAKPLVNNSVLSKSSVINGNSVVVKAVSSGGTGNFEYCYSYRKSTQSAWTDIKDYSSDKQVNFTPSSTGTYYVRVKIHDKSAGGVAQKALTLAVYENDLTNDSYLSKDSIISGNSIAIKAASTGGSGSLEYSYSFKHASQSKWTNIKDYCSSKIVSFTPSSTGKYYIRVKIHDKKTGVVSQKKLVFYVYNPLTNRSAISSGSAYTNDAVTLTASAKGGTGTYVYSYFYKSEYTKGAWKPIQTHTTEASVQFAPKAAAEYEILIKVIDDENNTADKIFTLSVSDPLKNLSRISSSSIKLGKSITIKGAASGGTETYEYSYFYRTSSGSVWHTIQGYTSDTTAVFTPNKAGEYEIFIKVRDTELNVDRKTLTLTVN